MNKLRVCLALLLFGVAAAAAARPDDIAERARKLQASAIVVDTHEDVPEQLEQKWGDLAVRGATPHVDIPRLKEGGVTAPFFAVYVAAEHVEKKDSALEALKLIDMVDGIVAAHPNDMVPAASVADIRSAKAAGKIAVLMGIEGGHAIEDSLGALRDFYRLGVRYMTLTHTNTNDWADSAGSFFSASYDPVKLAVHHGLTPFGKDVVREMNRLGMMVDISHVSDDTIRDVLATSRAPVFASHSSCRALCNVPRDLTDEEIRAIAAKGGVVMINFYPPFLDQNVADAIKARASLRAAVEAKYKNDPAAQKAALEEFDLQHPIPEADRMKVIEHIEHALKVGGPQAVGLGTDYDGIELTPAGLPDVSSLPWITEELLRRGHSEEEVRGILGENFLRFFGNVEDVSRSLSNEPPSTATIEKP
jgi:membrane dipeptidase